VLADVLARDGAQLSALQTQEHSFAAANNLAVLHAQWQAVTLAARAEHWRQVMMDALPETHRVELGPQARWLSRTLRAAGLAGLDPAEVLTTAIRQRSLTGARDIASVIDARIRRRITGMAPLPQPLWAQRIPDHVEPGHEQYITGLAAAMDQRTQRIGEQATEHQPAWAVTALGPVPADPLDRLSWQHNAAAIGAYRELAALTDPAQPIGPEPVGADPDLRAAWHDALARLGPANGPDVRALSDGALHLLRDGYHAQTQWAPRYVTDALRHVRIGAADAELQAIRRDALARASREGAQTDAAAAHQKLAGSYRAMAAMYRSHEMTLAATEQDRRQWQAVTEQPRRLALAADSELRRRHPGHKLPPLRSAEPEPVTNAEQAQLDLTPGAEVPESAQWITDLRERHAAFAQVMANRRNASRATDLDRAPSEPLPHMAPIWKGAILQPPKPAIEPFRPSTQHAWAIDREPEASG
jgi:hypothetical protein